MKDTIYIYMDFYKELIIYRLNELRQSGQQLKGKEVYEDIHNYIFTSINYTITKNIERGKQKEMEDYLNEFLHQQEDLIWED